MKQLVLEAHLAEFPKPRWHLEAAVQIKPTLVFWGPGDTVGLVGLPAMLVLPERKFGEKKAKS